MKYVFTFANMDNAQRADVASTGQLLVHFAVPLWWIVATLFVWWTFTISAVLPMNVSTLLELFAHIFDELEFGSLDVCASNENGFQLKGSTC